MDNVIRRAISLGMPAIEAIKASTLNPAIYSGLEQEIGGIGPGRWTDFVILENLQTCTVREVYVAGKLVARERKGGISAFLVPTSTPGFNVHAVIPLFGHSGSNEGIIQMSDVEIPKDHLIGEVGEGFKLLQCGDPTGAGDGSPGYGFGVENAPKDGTYKRGQIAMARTSDPKTGNGGQFFIINGDTSLPDPDGYTVFGTVTKGLDIVDKIAAAGVQPGGESETIGAPAAPISILRVAVTEKKA